MKLLFKRLSSTAYAPQRAHDTDAGYDLRADLGIGQELAVFPRSRLLVPTNITFCPPENTYVRIAPRSGLAFKHGIDIFAGVIDRGYRDGIGVIVYNSGEQIFVIKHGDKIAQAIVEVIAPIEELVDVGAAALPSSDRGTAGYGSTGR